MVTAAPAPRSSTYRASDGAAYERFLGRWSRVLARPFAEFARLPEDGAILDVGCGTGSLTLSLAERRRGRVGGIDIAAPYIAFARSRQGAKAPISRSAMPAICLMPIAISPRRWRSSR